jgi:UDP-hydrolysing UDP-N-acetyl-D-glucosamine 2-epimerase
MIKSPQLELSLLVVGMHLSTEFGSTIKEIEKDGYNIVAQIKILHADDTREAMARSVVKSMVRIENALEKIKPDILLLLGDRSEMLSGAVAATYLGIPIAHIHGGDVSGNIDDPVRHAITKLSHIHFAATRESAERIIRMGEEPWRVRVVGAPGLDFASSKELPGPEEISNKYGLDLSKPVLLMVQHSIIAEAEEAENQIRETLNAIVASGFQTVVVYPNADVGGRKMINVIRKYAKENSFIKAFKSIPHEDYLGIMKIASVMVGNSSSGIIEAPYFGLPVINVGTRQMGRQKSGNVIDVPYAETEISKAIQNGLSNQELINRAKSCRNIYRIQNTGINITKVLNDLNLDRALLVKRMTY